MVPMMNMTTTNDDAQHDVRDNPIVDSHRRLEHKIMSSITAGTTANKATKASAGGAQPTITTKPQGREGHHHTPQPTRGEGGRGGVAALPHIYIYICIYNIYIYIYVWPLVISTLLYGGYFPKS